MRKFSYEALRIATNNFSSDRFIGWGGSGRVYRGDLPDGTLVAVKNFSKALRPSRRKEFLRNVEAMSQIRHRNIVRVIGCCIDKDRLLLVTEYAENGSLYDLLHDPARKKASVFNSWYRRAVVCIGIARGLSYLHHDAIPRVIHQDIKPGNILLDRDFTPKIADFDLVKLIYDPDESELPCHTDRVVGTCGYMAPEYLQYGFSSDKSDVYSFGVVMLEILSGRRAIEINKDTGEWNIISRASKLVKKYMEVLEFIDPVLQEHDYPVDAAQNFINVAVLCVHQNPSLRPNMQEVMHILYGVCNSSRLSLRGPDLSMLDHQSHGNVWQGYSIGASTSINPEVQVGMVGKYPYMDETYAEMMDDILTRQEVETCIEQEDGEQEAAWYSNFAVTCSTSSTEDEGQCSILQSEKAKTSTETEPADSDTEFQAQGESEGIETYDGREQREQDQDQEQSNTATFVGVPVQMQRPGIILSGSGDLVERLSQTMSFKKYTKMDCPEAVYRPFRTRVFRRGGSRNLYTY